MTRDEIIQMAREAGLIPDSPYLMPRDHEIARLECFTELVEAHVRRKYQTDIELWKGEAATAEKWRGMALSRDPETNGRSVNAIWAEAAAKERESCALIAEWTPDAMGTNKEIAAAIRARGSV